MTNCHRCSFKKYILSNPLRRAKDGRRIYVCGRCGEDAPEDRPFERGKPRNLYIDIETGYGRVYTFDLRIKGEYISHQNIDKEPYIVCWSAGWVGENKIHSACVDHRAALKYQDAKILKPLRELIEQADIISGQNVEWFDLRMINARMAINGIRPSEGYKIQDTLKMLRKKYKFMSNRLDYIAPLFGFRPKEAMSNRDWLAIADHGDEKTLAKMLKYNRADVRNGKGVLEALLGLSDYPIEKYMHTLPSEPKDKRE